MKKAEAHRCESKSLTRERGDGAEEKECRRKVMPRVRNGRERFGWFRNGRLQMECFSKLLKGPLRGVPDPASGPSSRRVSCGGWASCRPLSNAAWNTISDN
ncbi:hypothetical protein CEXT_796471 [Caerostris extrusa]|uniref:Uncharacterized protein n=1 Tax=Caerostris extrusa TaxID=172846 RepID=A0AAV4NYZ6_CAEEX|nr:hypothetical protein CEXT_796471 [Caerostris extrusa]